MISPGTPATFPAGVRRRTTGGGGAPKPKSPGPAEKLLFL